MDKSASDILNLVMDRIKRYAPQAALVGGGLAGLNHLIAMKKQYDNEQSANNKDDNTIYLDIPHTKMAFDTDRALDVGSAAAGGALVGAGIGGATYLVASLVQKLREGKQTPPAIQPQQNDPNSGSDVYNDDKYAGIWDTPSTSQYLLDSGLAVGTTLGAGALGYKVVNSVLQNVRRRKEQDELERTKGEYSNLLSKKIYGMENKTAEDFSFKNIESFALAIHDSLEKVENKVALDKSAFSDPTMMSMMTSLPGVGALVAGILAHNYWYNKQQDVEAGLAKQESEKVKKSPSMIKIRTVDPSTGLEDKAASLIEDVAPAMFASEAIKDNMGKKEDAKEVHKDVFSPDNVQSIDNNTVVVRNQDGDTQINALDPKAVQTLEKYKEVIAKSIAMGVNLSNGQAAPARS